MSAFWVRESSAADGPAIRGLLASVFGQEFSEDEWRWKYALDPDGWFGTVGVLGERIVGHYAGWGMGLLVDGEPRRIFAIGDVATDPSARSLGGKSGVFKEMTAAFYARVAGEVPFCFGFPNARALAVSHRFALTRTLLPIELLVISVESFGPAPADAAAGDAVDETFDPLWEAARRVRTTGLIRDRARVNWRFHARPSRYYRMVWRASGTGMTAWAVLSVVGEEAVVADYLGCEADGRDLRPLFAAAAEEARRLGARRLVFWSSPGPGQALLASLPGERRAAGFPMIVRVFDEAAVRTFAERGLLVPSLYDLV
ncbi:MAG: GNAT family N-acetyltransferase [Acidobacteriota bacterium]